MNRFYAKEFARGKWHICDTECHNTPLYDDNREGKDKPRVFDEDQAYDVVEQLNQKYGNQEPEE